ncbi:MAG: UPF0182 family protein [Armatimonadetes bacterium]|nr:UPF0182 family protein [Armatimonadota bacterium]
MNNLRRYIGPIILAVIALLTIFGGALVTFYTDYLWFKDLGYQKVFTTRLLTQIKIGVLFGLMFFAIIYGNLWYARRIAPPSPTMGIEQQLLERLGRLARRGLGLLLFAGSVVVSVMVGLEAATHWRQWLMCFHSTPFASADPVFGKDIGFFVFQLPFLTYLYYWLFFALAASTIASIGLHYADEAIEMFGNNLQFAPKVKAHICTLVAAMFFLKAWGYRLAMYNLLFSKGSLFDGAGHTEIKATLPALWILLIAALIGGLLVLANIRRRGIGYSVGAFASLIGLSIVVGSAYPAFVQRYSVQPNELEYQSKYISRAVKATQTAYGLTQVSTQAFAAENDLTAQQIHENRATVENIRLWGKKPLQDQNNQLQTVQQYYHFEDIDVDRYWLADKNTGEKRYRQVWLGAREMSQAQLPDTAKTWINQHLKYTHGYAYCMSPVNEISEEGKPLFFVKDMPPRATVDMPIERMGVYFGELTHEYVIVKTSAEEYDYPSGSGTVPTKYEADAGIRVGDFWRKFLFSLRFQDINLLLNENIRPESRLLFRREIDDRISTLLPFIEFDQDPYLVTADGGLYWMRDGYTISDSYPYAKYFGMQGTPFNYIRNSVKVVVDAYTGKVDAYIIEDPLPDPLIRTYDKIFPGIFKPIDQMPDELREHIRYPEDLFRIQTAVYTRYHYSADRPQDFYGNSDLWEIPKTASLAGLSSEPTYMEPYYVIMKLPNGSSEEFILMTPYVHSGARKNMVAWMCAKCDQPNYGQLVLYQLPTKNVNGPQQVGTFASQDPTISSQLTLWNKEGSSADTGDMLIIPVESTFLYVVPVYLSSTTSGTQIPEIKRVVVALGDRVAMMPTLNDSLSTLVGQTISVPTQTGMVAGALATKAPGVTTKPAIVATPDTAQLVDQANNNYAKAQEALRNGDWNEYGKRMSALEKDLKDLKEKLKRK